MPFDAQIDRGHVVQVNKAIPMPRHIQKIDFTSPGFKGDPLPTFERMRAQGPVIRAKLPLIGAVWLTTTYDAASEVLKNKQDFVREPGNAGRRTMAGEQWWMPRSFLLLANNMLTRDEPDHRRLRSLVDKAFQRQGVEEMRPRIEAIANDLLETISEQPSADLVKSYARPLPLAVICELLGLPAEDRPKFMRWCAGLSTASSLFGIITAMPGIGKLMAYLREQFEICRGDPRPGLISALVEVENAGDKLSEDELIAMVFVLLIAGHETTTHLISAGTLTLLQQHDQRQDLVSDWSRIVPATNELMRYTTPVQFTKPRYASRDMVLYGQNIKRGDYIMAVLAAANCDPAKFEHPERLDLARNPNHHLGFGTGIHFCLAVQLALAEAQIAFESLFIRFPDLQLADPQADIKWTKRIGLRALHSLEVKTGA